MLDQVSADRLTRIRKTDVSALTEDDKAFLKARQSYLGKKDQVRYRKILK